MVELDCYYLTCSICDKTGKKHPLNKDPEIALENASEEYVANGWRSYQGKVTCLDCIKELRRIKKEKPSGIFKPRALDLDGEVS